ncbi:MAG: type ISP restriction/modification enzyme [Candidatus Competibacteraceae bacterium]
MIERGANLFPLYIKPFHASRRIPNQLSNAATDYLARLDTDAPASFHHIVAVLHAPAYRTENAGALKQDWPRILLPATREQLLISAELGQQIAALLETETCCPASLKANRAPELAKIALPTVADSTPLTPTHSNSPPAGATPARAASPCPARQPKAVRSRNWNNLLWARKRVGRI